MEETARDFRYAWRLLWKSPGFTLVAVMTLALGIGGNTTMFSAVRAVLLKPLHYRDPNRLVRVTVDFPGRPRASSFTPIRLAQMRAAPSVAELGSFLIAPQNVTLSGGAEPEALKGARVSANFLRILGVEPALGRSFLPEEDEPAAPPVVIISSELWRRRFAADPMIAGKTATLDSTPSTIIGVLPASFQFPYPGLDVWFPKPFAAPGVPTQVWPTVAAQIGFGRLKDGASLEQARAEMNVLSRQDVLSNPGLGDADPNSTVRVLRMQDQLVADVRPTLWMLFGAVGFSRPADPAVACRESSTALSIATGVLFGLFPSLRASRPDLADLLRLQGAGAAERRGALVLSTRGLLVVSTSRAVDRLADWRRSSDREPGSPP